MRGPRVARGPSCGGGSCEVLGSREVLHAEIRHAEAGHASGCMGQAGQELLHMGYVRVIRCRSGYLKGGCEDEITQFCK